jgi:selenocysteine-specific elongation factor
VKQIILGTAGHIDHGKTSLVRATTGIDTDRLKEEKLRGITIELGFAHLELPSGQQVGIVDVPGHEKFVKNMVAGATGIDIVAMVIAADEGVMPQTREHLEICSLLDVRHGFVALTKIDMVDEEMLELAREDIRDFVQGTFLENRPVVPVSAVTGAGIPEFVATLDALCREVPERKTTGLFRLPVDRVFTMRGFVTVITGSLVSGSVAVGETVMIYPAQKTAKVRGLQVHNQAVETATAGMRTALNFQGLERTAVERGHVLSNPQALAPSYMVDISLHFLASARKPLKNRTRVRFHTGTSEILGTLVLLGTDELPPGATVPAQIRLDTPVALVRDDRFVVRSLSPARTIGGGRVLNPIPPKHKRFRPEVVEGLSHLAELPVKEAVAFHARETGARGVSLAALRLMTNLPDKQIEAVLGTLLSRKTLIMTDRESRTVIHAEAFDALKAQLLEMLAAYHAKNPLKPGMPREEVRSKLPSYVDNRVVNLLLNQLQRSAEVVAEEETLRLPGHTISLGRDQDRLRRQILELYAEAGLAPPYFKDLLQQLELPADMGRDVMQLLMAEGQMVKVKEDLYFHAPAVEELKGRLVAFLQAEGEITTPRFKDMTGASRKYVIPLIEFFDTTRLTIRVGDTRRLRKQ